MTDLEIINACLARAKRNGYKTDWSYITNVAIFESLMFNHDFAKCFAGKDWNEYLVELVLEEDRMEFLKIILA